MIFHPQYRPIRPIHRYYVQVYQYNSNI